MGDTLLLLARLTLAAVLAVAGVAKLVDRAGSRQGMRDFGVPAALAPAAALLLPLAELVAALALVSARTAWYGGLLALALLVVFIAGISVSLAQGKHHDCRCFGQIASSPIGRGTLIRNGILAAIAAFVVLAGLGSRGAVGPSLWELWRGMTGMEQLAIVLGVASLALLGAVVWLLFQMLGQNGRILNRLDSVETRVGALQGVLESSNLVAGNPVLQAEHRHEAGLPPSTRAPSFDLPDLDNRRVTLEQLLAAGRQTLLLFTDPNCGPCNGLMPDIGRWQADASSPLTVAVISRGDPGANRAKSAEHGLKNVLLQTNYEVADAYQAHGTPAAVVVRTDGTIGSGVALGAEAIKRLYGETVAAPPAPAPVPTNGAVVPASRIGQPAPPVKLPDLGGRVVDLEEFRGNRTLVLFWNPGCGFCQQMLPDLKQWDASPPPDAPKLVVVSIGTPESNADLTLNSPVLLDTSFATGSAFGANGTPMAVLVDEEGKLASEVAAGAVAVLQLANGRR